MAVKVYFHPADSQRGQAAEEGPAAPRLWFRNSLWLEEPAGVKGENRAEEGQPWSYNFKCCLSHLASWTAKPERDPSPRRAEQEGRDHNLNWSPVHLIPQPLTL